MDYVDRQDIFNSQKDLSATAICMLLDFNDVWYKHRDTLRTKGLTPEIQSEYKKIAETYDVVYSTTQDKTQFLKLVELDTPTIH